jgi:hypothetical protein
MKFTATKAVVFLGIAFLLLSILPAYASAPNEPHLANAMWVEPSTITLTDYDVGDKFNVTIWTNMTTLEPDADGIYSWQVVIYYNTTYINATRVGLTGTGGMTSELFEGYTTFSYSLIEENYTSCYESLLGEEDYLPVPASGSLCWFEFEVLALEPLPIEFALNINNTDTWIVDNKLNSYPPYDNTLYDATVVPEFSPFLSVAILMFLTLVIAIFHGKITRNLKRHPIAK